jgi:signal transduction histidine kinase
MMLSIRMRFIAVSLASVTLAMVLTAWVFYNLFAYNLQKRIDAELAGHINWIAGLLAFEADGRLKTPSSPSDNRFYEAYSGLYWQIEDPSRKQQLRSPSLFDFALPLPDDRHETGSIHRYRLPGPDDSEVDVQERQIIVASPGGPRTLRVAVGIDASELDKAKRDFIMALLPYLAVLGMLLVVMSALQLSFGLRPLAGIAKDMARIRNRKADQLSGPYPAELQDLVLQLNELLLAQGKAMETARGRASDLAHGLKTPLTILANDALTLREKGETEIADELEQLVHDMQAHVQHELARSRIAQSPRQRRSDADVTQTLNDIIRTLKRTADGERLDWALSAMPGIMVPVDPQDLRELLGNLLENAGKWANTTVRATVVSFGRDLLVMIDDDGPGVDPDKITLMTKRGTRLDDGKPGTGLGLTIAKDITDVYGIDLLLENRPEGGFRVTLRLPGVSG